MRPPSHLLVIVAAAAPVLAYQHWKRPHGPGGCGGAGESALAGDLATLDNALRLYREEHCRYPSFDCFVEQMTSYTSAGGDASATEDLVHALGPYVRSIPPMPKGPEKGRTEVGCAAAPRIAWIYDEVTGRISPNLGP
jgi:hypothetical protein